MSNVLIHKARELKPQTRAALEAELGRSLDDSEDVSIMAFLPHEAPSGKARIQAASKLQEHLRQVDRKTRRVPESEIEETIQESLRNVRPRYRERE